ALIANSLADLKRLPVSKTNDESIVNNYIYNKNITLSNESI
ncbi:8371_t:CDS:1, partial [Racocetra persica]